MKNQLISASKFAKAIKNTVYLFKQLWKENTTMLLHAGRDTDKCTTALDIAASLDRHVVYVATENNLDAHVDRLAEISNLSVLAPKYDDPGDSSDYADLVINAIEEIITDTSVRTFIIDSVTRIAALSFGRNASAAFIMKRLKALQMRYNCSFLIISHDSTKATDRSLTNIADSDLSLNQPIERADKKDSIKEISVAAQPQPAASPQTPDNKPSPRFIPVNVGSSTPAAPAMSRRERRELERLARKAARRKTTATRR